MHYYNFRIYRNSAVIGVFVLCLAQLSGCGFIGIGHKDIDGAPKVDIDASKIVDAIPKEEPYHPYHNGSRDYVVGGHRYHVLKSTKGYVKYGNASWYGSKFHGNQTSTQERYNLYGMTAASTELPLPSYVQVTNLRNGKQVIVRVNDRGPFHSKRIIDLSYAAAKKLDFTDIGTAPVKVVGIDPKTWGKKSQIKCSEDESEDTNLSTKPTKNGAIYLQVGAFSQLSNAKQLYAKIAKLTDEAIHIKQKNGIYRVQVGPMENTADKNKLKRVLENKNII